MILVTPVGRALAKASGSNIIAVRIWPAQDYTRVTLEHDAPLRFTHFSVKDPERLVVDLEGVEFSAVLDGLARKLTPDDPYIRLLRAGRHKPGVVRLVMELKTEVAPQVFTLAPVADYGHRLVLDVYPVKPVDPMLALLERHERQQRAPEETSGNASLPRVSEEMAGPGLAKVIPGESERSEPARRKAKPAVDRLLTVTLDPGHGGEDPGAIGRRGSFEKNVTLAVARRLKEKIDAEPDMRAVLTRDSDFFVPLDVRVQKARRLQSDLFVSIHADAWIRPDARGSSVFVLSERGASSAAARWLAQKENNADLIGGINTQVRDPHLARTLLDLSQTATNSDSLKLGRAVLGELGSINRLHKASVEQAGFAVLKAPDIPSILVETAFISNPDEEMRLNDSAYQDRMATAILAGIRKYFAQNPPVAKSKMARI